MPRGEAKKSRIVREDLNVEISRKLIPLGIGWKENQQVFSDVAIVIFKKNECDITGKPEVIQIKGIT